ncbi:MAG: hypothetical protein GXP54_04985 [Deltaproteobacteria bacterium]|nr:hypothetical protein [Deltaproteobacteria bacterium]
MRLRYLSGALLFALSCGEIEVPLPDPDIPPEKDLPVIEADLGAADTAECRTDDDCNGPDTPDCMKARCNADRLCVTEPKQEGTTCVLDPPVDGPCQASECNGQGKCEAVSKEDGTACAPAERTPGHCETFVCEDGQCTGKKGCDDGNPCTDDYCDNEAGKCRHEPLNEGQCDDLNPCTLDDACFAGTCTGTPNPCDDANPCTLDKCLPEQGCLHPPDNGAPCDDGNLCTLKDKCSDGKCESGAIKVCNDQNPCTNDKCNPDDGKCVSEPNNEECSDGDSCTVGDLCKEGQCVPGGPLDCNDYEPCTKDHCDPNQGCLHDLQPDCLDCKTADDCGESNQCILYKCEMEGQTGKCATVQLSGIPCVDQNPCMIGDFCKNGTCVSGEKPNCDDGNPCTDDVCNQLDGSCEYAPNTLACDDDDDCTYQDLCDNGVCAGSKIQCDDQNECTKDSCDKGACEFLPLDKACDDGDPDTGPDQCVKGTCMPGPLLNCQGRPDGTSCSDQDDGTNPDYCLAGVCRGFVKKTFQEGGLPTYFTDVDAGSGKAFVTGYYQDSAKAQTGFVAGVTFKGTPTVIDSTTALGQVYRAVSNLLAVGDGGLVAYSPSWLGGTSWIKGGVVGFALSNQGQSKVGDLAGVFGGIGFDLSVTQPTGSDMPPYTTDCDYQDHYLVVGRFAGANASALVRHCVIGQVQIDPDVGCLTQASCGKTHITNQDATMVYPGVASGSASKCGVDQACLKEAVFAGLVADPAGAAYQGMFRGSLSVNSLFEDFESTTGLPSNTGTVRDMVRTADVDGNSVYMAVGDGGLLAYGPADGPFKQVNLSDGPAEYSFNSVAAGGQYQMIVGTRTSLDAKALVLILHSVDKSLDDATAYSELVLDWCPTQTCGSFDLTGVSVSGGSVFITGNSTEKALGNPVGVMYFLTL